MVVKDRRGRRRYIIFRVEGEDIDRRCLLHLLRHTFPRAEEIKLIQFDGKLGIVRCPHLRQQEVIERLNSIANGGVKITALRSSGTLKSLRERYPIEG